MSSFICLYLLFVSSHLFLISPIIFPFAIFFIPPPLSPSSLYFFLSSSTSLSFPLSLSLYFYLSLSLYLSPAPLILSLSFPFYTSSSLSVLLSAYFFQLAILSACLLALHSSLSPLSPHSLSFLIFSLFSFYNICDCLVVNTRRYRALVFIKPQKQLH